MYVLVSVIVLFGVTLNYNAGGQPVAATSSLESYGLRVASLWRLHHICVVRLLSAA